MFHTLSYLYLVRFRRLTCPFDSSDNPVAPWHRCSRSCHAPYHPRAAEFTNTLPTTVGPLPQHAPDPFDTRRLIRCHLLRTPVQAKSVASICRSGLRRRKGMGRVRQRAYKASDSDVQREVLTIQLPELQARCCPNQGWFESSETMSMNMSLSMSDIFEF